MTTCPQCSAENPPEAATCRRCGHALRPAEPQGQAELPSWLQQLNPDAAAPSQAAAKPVAPPAAPPAPPAPAATPGPVAARQAAAPPTERVVEQRAAAPASRPAGQAESGALIGEEDLPAWLRAWEANASTAKRSSRSKSS